MLQKKDIVVIGDEVESILTAVSAARLGASVMLVRQSTNRLGGLSTRGGLAYMDITPEYKAPLFKEFLERANVVRVALNPDKGHDALKAMLDEAGVTVMDGVVTEPDTAFHPVNNLKLSNGNTIESRYTIDATPDVDFARLLGIPYIEGMGGLFGDVQNFLGISPVFRLKKVHYLDLQAFEEKLRARQDMAQLLEKALPHHDKALVSEYKTRPTFAPADEDYLDILNPAIGIAFHNWLFGTVDNYPKAKIWIDGGNVARLGDEDLAFNGLVMREKNLAKLLDYSHGGKIPEELTDAMEHFTRFLREIGGFEHAYIEPPEALYIRQTVTLKTRKNITATDLLNGGVSPDKAIGTASYWFDTRGIVVKEHYPDAPELPKPVFNVGLDGALFDTPGFENFAVVSRSGGYSPLAQGTCRIVQHNAMLGEAIGIAAGLAAKTKVNLIQVPPYAIKQELETRYGGPVPCEGKPTMNQSDVAICELIKRDQQITQTLGQPEHIV